MEPAHKPSIFISYAHKDGAAIAQRLRHDLAANGYEVWLDVSRLVAGGSWSFDIEAALDRSDVLIALLSRRSYVSDICRGEQLRALRKSKRVIPVILDEAADRPVFLEAKQFVSFAAGVSYQTSLQQLLDALGSIDTAIVAKAFEQTYVTVPRLPRQIVERPDELTALKQRLLRDEPSNTIEVIAVTGMGGIGKTMLAQMIGHDPIVQSAFPDGVIWIEIGKDVKDLVPKLREVGRALGDEPGHYDTAEGSTNRLRTILQKKAALIILDDVWQLSQVEPFLADVPNSRLLITTRNQEIVVSLQAGFVAPTTLTSEQAIAVLEKWTAVPRNAMPPEAAAIVRECGSLPLALAMIGGLVRSGLAKGRSDAWTAALRRLQDARLDEIRLALENYPYRELQRAIQVSVDDLEPLSLDRYLSMSIFREDDPVPERVLETFWRTDRYDAQRTIDRWLDTSLATRDAGGRIRLHDLQFDYVRSRARDKLAVFHQQLLDAYAVRYGADWRAIDDQTYFVTHVAGHMAAARKWRELAELLVNQTFIRARLDASSYLELLHDFHWSTECLAAIDSPSERALFQGVHQGATRLKFFIDRVMESAVVERWLDEGEEPASAMVVVGPSGVGKTAFLRNIQFRSFRDWTFIVARRFPNSSEDLLFELALEMSVLLDDPGRAEESREAVGPRRLQQVETLASAVKTTFGRPVCFIVDSAEKLPLVAVRDLMEFSRRSSGARTIVAGISSPVLVPGQRVLQLENVSAEATAKTLQTRFGKRLDRNLIDAVIKMTNGRIDLLMSVVSSLEDGFDASDSDERSNLERLEQRGKDH